MKVAIVGAGPAGLLAAWGVTRYLRPKDITIYDADPTYRPERIFALQYLHDTCTLPSHALKKLTLNYSIIGLDPKLQEQVGFLKAAKYQYNAKLSRPLSEENSTHYAGEEHQIYSLKQAYGFLHEFFAERMEQLALTWQQITLDLPQTFDKVVSTAPLPKLLPEMTWPTIDMWITQGYLPIEMPEGTCAINVDPKVGWLRATFLDGGKATEWASVSGEVIEYQSTNIPRLAPLKKIVSPPKLPALPERVYLAGRWGSWDAGVLTHHAYYRARNIMDGAVLG